MSKKTGGETVTVPVDTVAKLLRKLGGHHDLGVFYEYTYQDKPVVSVDSTKAGRLAITVMASAWATKVAEYVWQYEVDESVTTDPTTGDPTVDGWSAVLLTDSEEPEAEEDDDTSSETEDAEEVDDSEDGDEQDADLTEDEDTDGDDDED